MRKLYEKRQILFSVIWILVYCFATIPIRGELGDESIWMLIALAVIAVGITVFVKVNHHIMVYHRYLRYCQCC